MFRTPASSTKHPPEQPCYSNLQEVQQLTNQESELQARRERVAISLRKEGREHEILKRRKQNITAVLPIIEQSATINPFQEKLRQFKQKTYDIGQLQQLGQCMASGDLEKAYYGIIGIRKLLSSDPQPPIQMVIDANLVPRIIEFAKQSEYIQLQSEAVWALSNIASGTPLQTQSIIDKGGIQLFVDLLKSNNQSVLEHAIWAIANIAGDRVVYRDNLIKHKVIDLLSKLILTSPNPKMVGQSCWAISNMIRLKPLPKYETIKNVIPVLASMITRGQMTDADVITSTLWALSFILESNDNRISRLVNTGIVPKLIELLSSESIEVVGASLRTLGNICEGSQLHVQALLLSGIIQKLQVLLNHKKKSLRREICWVLSNITNSAEKHVTFLFSHQSLIENMYMILTGDQIVSIKLEAGYMFAHAGLTGDPTFLTVFYHQHNFMQIFLNFVRGSNADNVDMIEMGLVGVKACLTVGQQTKQQNGGTSVLMDDLLKNDGIEVIENAQFHKANKIYKRAAQLLKTFFQLQDPLQP